jgi:putative endonuclease
MHHCVYILYSVSCCKFYTGQTQDFKNRIKEHNRGETPSIKTCRPWKLLWHTDVETRSEAVKLEKKIKGRGAERFLADNGIIVR